MGNERRGCKRITFFLHDNTALQMREYAYAKRMSLTEYVTGAILRRIRDEREDEISLAKRNMLPLQKRVPVRPKDKKKTKVLHYPVLLEIPTSTKDLS